MTRRQSTRPDRRVEPAGSIPDERLARLAERLRYAGISIHKLHPGNYGLVPPVNPRPSKSPCDDLRDVLKEEAEGLFRSGILAGMVSPFAEGITPKYVWALDQEGEVYEAKTKPPDTLYHGYRLGDDEREMRRYIRREWQQRCPRL
ncbi:MAG: hypothetical protein ACREE9_17950 [Stellaceae bacterium]